MPALSPHTETLGIKNASHLLRRITFGGNVSDIKNYSTKLASEALTDFFADTHPIPAPPIDLQTMQSWLPKPDPTINSDDSELAQYYKVWHLHQMASSVNSAKERIVYFLHTLLPVQYSIVRKTTEIYYQNTLYRHFAFGSYKELIKKVCIDNAMLRYIDNRLNESASPNENFARELLELYTIGKGEQISSGDYTNYTEADIREAAKILSGYKIPANYDVIDPETNIPVGYVKVNSENQAFLHNADIKKFSSAFGNTEIEPNEIINGYATAEATIDELDQLIEMIFAQEETAKFLCRKIYRFFVYHKIDDRIENEIITPLAETLRNNNYELAPALKQLLESQHFYDTDNTESTDNQIGALIKSPIDLVIGSLKLFNIQLPTAPLEMNESYSYLLDFINRQGMSFYEPIDVKGYPPYHQIPIFNRYWISANTIGYRYQFGALLEAGTSDSGMPLGFKLDSLNFIEENISVPDDEQVIVTELIEYLLTNPVPQERFDYFLSILTDGLEKGSWKHEWQLYENTKDSRGVTIQLGDLIVAILQSPEYQLF